MKLLTDIGERLAIAVFSGLAGAAIAFALFIAFRGHVFPPRAIVFVDASFAATGFVLGAAMG